MSDKTRGKRISNISRILFLKEVRVDLTADLTNKRAGRECLFINYPCALVIINLLFQGLAS